MAQIVPQANQTVLTLPNGKPVRPWIVLISVIFGFFMSLLDATIVNIALTNIQLNLKTDLTTVSWVLNAYTVVFAAVLVTMGRFADQFGRKRIYMTGMVLFSVGSLLCASAPTIELLIVFRAIQGLGAAALDPISLAIITAVFPAKQRGGAVAIWGSLAGLAAAVGPVLGGFLLQIGKGNLEWRAIFFINIPFCIVGLYMVWRNVPETRDVGASRKIDVIGLVTLAAGLAGLVFAIIQGGGDWGWTDAKTLGTFGLSLVLLVVFFFYQIRLEQPLLDFRLFRIRSFSAANISAFMFGTAIQGGFLMLVLFLINVQGYSTLNAAYAFIPVPLAAVITAGASNAIKIEARFRGMLGLFLIGIGLLSLTTITPDAGYLDTTWRGVLIGLGAGFCFTSFPLIVLAEIPKQKLGVGSGTFNTFQQIGFAIGVALLISIFAGRLKDTLPAAGQSVGAIIQSNQDKLPAPALGVVGGYLGNLQQRNGSLVVDDAVNEVLPQTQSLGVTEPQLRSFFGRISNNFKQAQIDAFSTSYFSAAMIALFAIIPAFFAKVPLSLLRNREAEEDDDTPNTVAVANS